MVSKAKSSKLYCEFSTGGDLNLEGNASALQELVALLEGRELGSRSMRLDASIDPRPYDGALEEISVQPSSKAKVRFARDEATLRIEGNRADLQLLARNISVLIESADHSRPVTPHLHLDYYPDHVLLRYDSESIVVTCAE